MQTLVCPDASLCGHWYRGTVFCGNFCHVRRPSFPFWSFLTAPLGFSQSYPLWKLDCPSIYVAFICCPSSFPCLLSSPSFTPAVSLILSSQSPPLFFLDSSFHVNDTSGSLSLYFPKLTFLLTQVLHQNGNSTLLTWSTLRGEFPLLCPACCRVFSLQLASFLLNHACHSFALPGSSVALSLIFLRYFVADFLPALFWSCLFPHFNVHPTSSPATMPQYFCFCSACAIFSWNVCCEPEFCLQNHSLCPHFHHPRGKCFFNLFIFCPNDMFI